MLYAQLFKRLLSGLGAPGFHILIALPNTLNSLLEVMMLPFQIFGQGLIQCGNSVLAAAQCIRFQLGLAFRFDGYYIHDAFRVGVVWASVNGRPGTG